MAIPIKNTFSESFLKVLAEEFQKHYTPFSINAFVKSILTSEWETYEFKQRIHCLALNIQKYLPQEYQEALPILLKVAPKFERYHAMIFPHFVQCFGVKDYKLSVPALAKLTTYGTSEFAIRVFIEKYPEKMMKQMLLWSKDKNEHIRRLASEGCRPKLPWAPALLFLRADPSPIFPILENLKEDPSQYVRKSVANNLNDISKDHTDLILTLAKQWYGKNILTDKILKHALRTELKKGNPKCLKIFGYSDLSSLEISTLKLQNKIIQIGETLSFSFTIKPKKIHEQNVRIAYVLYFYKQNQTHTRKVFKISEAPLLSQRTFQKTHSFKNLSTRKHHAGVHFIALQINGIELPKIKFTVI